MQKIIGDARSFEHGAHQNEHRHRNQDQTFGRRPPDPRDDAEKFAERKHIEHHADEAEADPDTAQHPGHRIAAEQQRRQRETNLRENGYWLGQLIAYERTGLDIRDILTYDELVASLTPEIVQKAAELYLRTDNYVQVSLYPEEQPEEQEQD